MRGEEYSQLDIETEIVRMENEHVERLWAESIDGLTLISTADLADTLRSDHPELD